MSPSDAALEEEQQLASLGAELDAASPPMRAASAESISSQPGDPISALSPDGPLSKLGAQASDHGMLHPQAPGGDVETHPTASADAGEHSNPDPKALEAAAQQSAAAGDSPAASGSSAVEERPSSQVGPNAHHSSTVSEEAAKQSSELEPAGHTQPSMSHSDRAASAAVATTHTPASQGVMISDSKPAAGPSDGPATLLGSALPVAATTEATAHAAGNAVDGPVHFPPCFLSQKVRQLP